MPPITIKNPNYDPNNPLSKRFIIIQDDQPLDAAGLPVSQRDDIKPTPTPTETPQIEPQRLTAGIEAFGEKLLTATPEKVAEKITPPKKEEKPKEEETPETFAKFAERQGFKLNPLTGEVIEPTPELVEDFNKKFETIREPEKPTPDLKGEVPTAPAEVAKPQVSGRPTEGKRMATLISPEGEKKVVEVGSQEASDLQTAGFKLDQPKTKTGEIDVPKKLKDEGVTLTGDETTDQAISDLATKAGEAGMSLEDFITTVKAKEVPTAEESEEIRNKLGIPGLIDKAFEKPAQTTAQQYKDLYEISGLKEIKNSVKEQDAKITKARQDLVKATGALHNNPWISQASRTGRLRILNQLAQADINNLISERELLLDSYDEGIDEIEETIKRDIFDRGLDRELTVDKLNFLLTEAERDEEFIERQAERKALRFVPEFLRGVTRREEVAEERVIAREERVEERAIAREERAEQRAIEKEGRAFARDLAKAKAKAEAVGFVERVNEEGTLIQGTEPPKIPTQGERQSFIFFQRMNDAVTELDILEEQVSAMGIFGQLQIKADSPIFQSKEIERYKQAMRLFTEARLRKDSGAAIPPSEFRNDELTYFPQPGDTAETLRRKEIARGVSLNAIRTASANAYWETFGESPVIAIQRERLRDIEIDTGAETTGLETLSNEDFLGGNQTSTPEIIK